MTAELKKEGRVELRQTPRTKQNRTCQLCSVSFFIICFLECLACVEQSGVVISQPYVEGSKILETSLKDHDLPPGRARLS